MEGAPKRTPGRVAIEVALQFVVAGLGLTYVAAVFRSLRGFVHGLDHGDQIFFDFVYHYYPMAQRIFDGDGPVQGYFYPPVFAIILSPLSRLSLTHAMLVWGAMQAICLAGLIYVGRREIRSVTGGLALTLLLVTSQPVLHNLKWGQISLPITVLVVGAFLAARRGRGLLAGLLLGTAAALKYYAVLFLVVFLIGRRWRLVTGFALTLLVLLAVIPLLTLGPTNTLSFYEGAGSGAAEAAQWVSRDLNSQFLPHVAARLLAGRGDALPRLQAALAVAGLLLLVWQVFLVWRLLRVRPEETMWAGALIFVILPFLLTTSWPHYFVYLPLLQVLAGATLLRCAWRWFGKGAAVILLLFPSVILGNIATLQLLGSWKPYGFLGCSFFANLLILVLLDLLAFHMSRAVAGVQKATRGGRPEAAPE